MSHSVWIGSSVLDSPEIRASVHVEGLEVRAVCEVYMINEDAGDPSAMWEMTNFVRVSKYIWDGAPVFNAMVSALNTALSKVRADYPTYALTPSAIEDVQDMIRDLNAELDGRP